MSFTRISPGSYVSPDRKYRIRHTADGWVLETNPLGGPPSFSVTCRSYRDAVSSYVEMISYA